MYSIELIQQDNHLVKFKIKQQETLLSFREVFELWANSDAFITFYVDTLKQFNYPAFYWEHPALMQHYLQRDYECILQKSLPLEGLAVDEGSFSAYLHNSEAVADFRNLGKDARLIIPTKQAEEEIYNHMGRFIRLADAKQIQAVFQRVGQAVIEELNKQGVIWLNTAGLGVIWLHIRLDTYPKYYKTKEYTQINYFT